MPSADDPDLLGPPDDLLHLIDGGRPMKTGGLEIDVAGPIVLVPILHLNRSRQWRTANHPSTGRDAAAQWQKEWLVNNR